MCRFSTSLRLALGVEVMLSSAMVESTNSLLSGHQIRNFQVGRDRKQPPIARDQFACLPALPMLWFPHERGRVSGWGVFPIGIAS